MNALITIVGTKRGLFSTEIKVTQPEQLILKLNDDDVALITTSDVRPEDAELCIQCLPYIEKYTHNADAIIKTLLTVIGSFLNTQKGVENVH